MPLADACSIKEDLQKYSLSEHTTLMKASQENDLLSEI